MAKRKSKVISHCRIVSVPDSSVWWFYQVGNIFPVVWEHKTTKKVEVMIDNKGIWPKGQDERNYWIPMEHVEIIRNFERAKEMEMAYLEDEKKKEKARVNKEKKKEKA